MVKIRQAVDNPMGGQYDQSAALHGDKGHHQELMRGLRTSRIGNSAALIAVGQRRLIAMVSIGNEELLIAHQLLNFLDDCGIVYAPETVPHLIFIQHKHVRLGFSGQQAFNLGLRVTVEHENLAKMRPGMAQQVQTVFTGLGVGLFMPEDHLIGIVMHSSQCNKAAPLGHFMGAGHGKGLGIEIYRRFMVLLEDAAGTPVMQVLSGAGIDVESGAVGLP